MKVRWDTAAGEPAEYDLAPVVALAAGKNATDGVFPSGSAVLLSDTFALTAAHVLKDYWDRAEYGPLQEGENVPSFQIVAAGGFGEVPLRCQWDVRKVWTASQTDIAVLSLSPREGVAESWRYPAIDLAPPEVGDVVVACGFAESSVTEVLSEGTPAFEWTDRPTVSRGFVTAVHPQRRDAGLLNFPCFEFDARVDGGMSGGAVFSTKGHLLGVVVSGEGSPSAGYNSAAALAWAAMNVRIEGSYFGCRPGPCCLLTLADQGAVGMENRHRVREALGPDGSVLGLHLTIA